MQLLCFHGEKKSTPNRSATWLSTTSRDRSQPGTTPGTDSVAIPNHPHSCPHFNIYACIIYHVTENDTCDVMRNWWLKLVATENIEGSCSCLLRKNVYFDDITDCQDAVSRFYTVLRMGMNSVGMGECRMCRILVCDLRQRGILWNVSGQPDTHTQLNLTWIWARKYPHIISHTDTTLVLNLDVHKHGLVRQKMSCLLTQQGFLGGGGKGGNLPSENGIAPPGMGYDQFNTGQSQYKASPPQF